ncbi:siderophore biosynthesis protein [Saccharothrix coeruleofusca]|uniref:Siderophore biosynthesis protein n=2 Tax=Saccharothrix coeruleofusca TaxID=33919 RepID=A0A918ALX4_9PSEU|nr:siderophore biosynthesis protein [Saccharothrix coeruleofusca]
MDFGLFYFSADSTTVDEGDRYGLLLAGARFADTHGFSAVWTPERHFHQFGGLYPNPAVTGAAIAAVTERVAIRAGSVVAPAHHPARMTEEWAVVDNLSHGRVGVSFASGWSAVDFSFTPENYSRRRELVFEHAQAVRRLWRGEDLDVVDGTGAHKRVRVFPPPVQAELPVWITSSGDVETFRRAGRIGAGLLTHLLWQDVEELDHKIQQYRAEFRAATGGGHGHVALMVHTFLGDSDDEVREQVRGPLCAYLRSSLNLFAGSGNKGAQQFDPATMRPTDVDFLVQNAFDRYYAENGLLGDVEKGRKLVDRLRGVGVDEVACLIDFGLPAVDVLNGLNHLDELRQLCRS